MILFVKKYLEQDRSFEGGLKIYMQLGPSASFKQVLNRQGYSAYNHELLLEELRKLAGITPNEFKALVKFPAVPMEIQAVSVEEKTVFVADIPDPVRKTIRLRQEFPFLAEPNCPNELKIMVADMFTAYDRYVASHKRLFEALSPDDLKEAAASVVEDYLTNRQIWDELNYYKKEGKVLGNHKIFACSLRIKEIQEMPTPTLVKLCNSLKSNVTKTNKKIKENPKGAKTADWKAKLDNYLFELAEVNRMLGLNG